MSRIWLATTGLVAAACWGPPAAAQPRVQIPDTNLQWTAPGAPTVAAPPGMSPVIQATPPNAMLQAPEFDPYAMQSGTPLAPTAPMTNSWPGAAPASGTLLNGTEPYPANNPPSLYPNGAQLGLTGPSMRFLQAPRLRHAWIYGDKGQQLQINDTDVSLAFAWPNFLFSSQPLYVVPSFSLHLWDGPKNVPPGQTDLPSKAYSAFLDSGWESNPDALFGGEIGVRAGVFTDFNTLVNDSFRIQGKGLFRLRVTPTVQLRGGVLYADRVRVKLLPAGGILWTPNPQTRFDIYFPNPKFSQYLTTYGNTELWWYVAGEYGGGSWTIKRAFTGVTDQVDINDIRLILGLEWGPGRFFRRGRRVGFFEAAWVTSREIIYRGTPADDVRLNDSFMLRAGFGY